MKGPLLAAAEPKQQWLPEVFSIWHLIRRREGKVFNWQGPWEIFLVLLMVGSREVVTERLLQKVYDNPQAVFALPLRPGTLRVHPCYEQVGLWGSGNKKARNGHPCVIQHRPRRKHHRRWMMIKRIELAAVVEADEHDDGEPKRRRKLLPSFSHQRWCKHWGKVKRIDKFGAFKENRRNRCEKSFYDIFSLLTFLSKHLDFSERMFEYSNCNSPTWGDHNKVSLTFN